MRILVVGASRGLGLRLVENALGAEHHVTAFARRIHGLGANHPRLRSVAGDVMDRASVEAVVEGQDAVCWTLGTRPSLRPVRVFSEGTGNVLAAMARAGVGRLLVVTGVGTGDSRGHGGLLYDRLALPLFLKTIYDDKDRQEDLVRQSGVEWVLVRPGFLTNGPLTGRYRILMDLTGVRAGWISRSDVAHFLLEESAGPRYSRRAVLLTR